VSLWTWCCIDDGGRPSGAARQGEALNHRKLRRLNGRGGERCGKGAARLRQVRTMKANESKPLMTCREEVTDIKTRGVKLPWDEREGNLCPAHVVSGMEAARAWFRRRCGTWEPVHRYSRHRGRRKGDLQAEETARGRVPMRSTGADHLVVVMKPGNAGGAKGVDHPGVVDRQPPRGGRN